MSLEHIPKIDFAGVVTDTFDASRASINASEYSTSAQNQSLINTLVEIIAVYISDNIATDKNCLIHLSKVLYDANYKLLYKLSQDENFIDKLRQKLVITDSSASSKPALTSADFDRMKNTIVNQVKAAIKDAVKKNKSETDRQINDVAKAFNANKDKPATSPSNVKIPETASDNTTTEQNAVETNDGTIDFNKLEPVLPHTQLTPVWLTSRSVITNNLRKLNINASNRTIALLTVAFKKTTVQAAIDTLTGAIDKNAKAIHRTSAAALTATTVGATAGSVLGRAHKPSVFSKNSSFALGAKSALAKVGSVANPFFKKLFTTTKNTIVGTYKITKTILVSIARLTNAVLVTLGNAIKFTFVTLPKSVFSGVKRINKFLNEKVLNNSIVKGILRFLLSPAIVYIVGFIAGFITEKIKEAGGIRAVLTNLFTGAKNRIGEDDDKKTKLGDAIKSFAAKTREDIRIKAKEDKANGKSWYGSIWICLDMSCSYIEALANIIGTLYKGIKDIATSLYNKSAKIIKSITEPFTSEFNEDLTKILKKNLDEATEEEKLAAANVLAKNKGFGNYFSEKHNKLTVEKLRDLYSADQLNISIGKTLNTVKDWFTTKLSPVIDIALKAKALVGSKIAQFALSCVTLLQNDTWLASIPDPLIKFIAGAVMLTIRGIIASFRERKETNFELSKNFESKFGISVDKAAEESHSWIDNAVDTYELTPENLTKLHALGILRDTDIIKVEDPNTKERKQSLNAINVKYRLHHFINALTREHVMLNEFTNTITAKDKNNPALIDGYLDVNATQLLPKLTAERILSFPLIGISKPIELNRKGLTGSAIYEYNRKLIYMLNLKRGIISELSNRVLGELRNGVSSSNFNKLLLYSSDIYLHSLQPIFKLPVDVNADNKDEISKKLIDLHTITDRKEFSLFDYDPTKPIKVKKDNYNDIPGGRSTADVVTRPVWGDWRAEIHLQVNKLINDKLYNEPTLTRIAKLGLFEPDELEKAKKMADSLLGKSETEIIDLLSPTKNDEEAYIIKSREDLLAAMLSQAGIEEHRIHEIIVNYKAREDDWGKRIMLTRELYDTLKISNRKLGKHLGILSAAN